MNLKIKKIASLALAMTLLATSVPVVSAASYDQAKAVQYLKDNSQNDWVIIALGAANSLSGVDINFLKQDPGNIPTDIEKRILALAAAGQNPETFGAVNLIQKLLTFYNGAEISTPGNPTLLSDDVFGLLALAAANKHPEVRAQLVSFLKQYQNADGGWSHFKTGSSNADYTAMTGYALISAGEPKNSQVINRAFSFLSTAKKSGGFSHFPVTSADPYTTSWVIPALAAGGRTVPPEAVSYLAGFQKSNGSFEDSAILTAYAVIALNNLNSGSGNSISVRVGILGPNGSIWEGNILLVEPLAINTVKEAAKIGGFAYIIKNTDLGLYVESIAGIGPQGDQGWMYAVNGIKPSVSAANYTLQNSDNLIWFYGSPQDEVPSSARASEVINLSVNIIDNPSPPAINLSANKTEIKIGEEVLLSWSSQNATQVLNSSPNSWAGNNLSGSITVQPSQTTTYTITVQGPGGNTANSMTITVNQSPSIVFGVDRTSINFGNLKKGELSPAQTIKVKNEGNIQIKITASLVNADPLYREGLFMNHILWQNYQTSLSPNFQKSMDMVLRVPSDYQESNGQKNATLILWAQAK